MNAHNMVDAAADAPLEQTRGLPLLPDPMQVWQVFRRNLKLFLAVAGAVLALVALAYFVQEKRYTASSALLIAPSDSVIRTPDLNQPNAASTDDKAIDTQMRLMNSPEIAERAARAYAVDTLSPDGDAWSEDEIESLASRIKRTYTVIREGDTRVLNVEANSPDPTFAATVANLVAQSYIQWQLEGKQAEASGANAFLRERLAELEAEAVATQSAVDNFKVERGLMSAGGATIAEQEVSTLNQQLATARADLAEKEGRLNAARSQLARGGGGADVGAALGSGTIGTLRAQEADASARLAVLTERYGQLHPERRQVERQLADIRSQIQLEINRILSSLEAEVITARSRVNSLAGSRGAATGALAANGRAQAGLNELQQKADAARTIYENFLARSKETAALEFAQLPDIKLAERATVPRSPTSPNALLFILMGIVGSLAASIGAIGVAEYVRTGIATKRDVQSKLGVRYAGAVPTLESTIDGPAVESPQDYVVNHPQSLFTEAFRSIRAFLLLSAKSEPRTITVVSALPQEGKSTTAVCLGRVSAMEGLPTILVDTDLRRCGTSQLIGIPEDKPDLYDYFSGEASLDEVLVIDHDSGLHVLGVKAPQSSPVNPLVERNIERMFTELKARYEVIIIDTAPILGVAESRLLARMSDRVLALCEWRKTSANAIQAVIEILRNTNATVSGVALTQVDIRKYASTGDGDVYGYTKKFRGYYVD